MSERGRDDDLDKATQSIQVACTILAGAAQYGCDVGALAARFGLSAEDLSDPDARFPGPVGVAMWEQVPRIVGDDLFGLHLGERSPGAGVLPVVGYVVQTSPTVGEGILRALRYQRLVQTLNRVDLHVGDGEARIAFEVQRRHVEPLRHAMDFALAQALSLITRLTAAPVVPRRARFGYAAPSRVDEHCRVFGSDVHFDAPVTEIVLDPAVLERFVPSADPQLRAFVERHAEALLARLPASGSLTDRVRAAILEGLGAQRAHMTAVAGALRLTTRTLQRRLREEGTSHGQLLDDARRDLAARYVADRTVSLCEVAFLLGFSDQTTFHRAFVRWTGRTPGAVRRSVGARG